MATATITGTTSRTDLVNAWKYVYAPLTQGINFTSEEYGWADQLSEVKVDWSTRSTIMPVDIYEKTGVASLPEAGWKARPSSQNLVDATIDLQHFNVSFTASELAKWAGQGSSNQVQDQLKLQGAQSVAALGRHVADYFHGTSVGTLALTDTDLSGTSDTLTLVSGYGNTAITNAAFIIDKFRVGDWIAAIDGSDLETNAIGQITARNLSTPTIAVTWNGSTSETNNNLKIVKANSMENTTIDGSDYNKGLVGIQDILFTASVHGISNATVTDWDVASSGSSGGRFNGIRFRFMKDQIANEAPSVYKPDRLMVAQGVRRDMIAYERTGLRFTDSDAMEIDGDVKSKGFQIQSTRRVMPGSATVYSSKALKKISLMPQPDAPGWEDAEKLENRSVLRFDMDLVMGLVCLCRKAFAVETGLTESSS